MWKSSYTNLFLSWRKKTFCIIHIPYLTPKSINESCLLAVGLRTFLDSFYWGHLIRTSKYQYFSSFYVLNTIGVWESSATSAVSKKLMKWRPPSLSELTQKISIKGFPGISVLRGCWVLLIWYTFSRG